MWLNHSTFLVNMCVTGIWIHLQSKHLSLYTCPGRLRRKAIWMGLCRLWRCGRRSREPGLIWHTCGAKEIQSSSWTGAWGRAGSGPGVIGGRGFTAELHHMALSWNFLPTSLYIEATTRAARGGSSWSHVAWMTCSLGLTMLHFSLIKAVVQRRAAIFNSCEEWIFERLELFYSYLR